MLKFLRYWYNALRGEPTKNAYEAVQDAFKVSARRIAEAEYHKHLVRFYVDRTKELLPRVSESARIAQDFADAMWHKEHHTNDFAVETKRATEAHAKVQACYDRLQSLTKSAD